jgi:23S rRNA pseudouridine2605 synthase
MKARLQKVLAEAGRLRRASEELIQTAGSPSTGRGGWACRWTRCGRSRSWPACCGGAKEYWLLNKPAGVLSAVADARGRRTVTDCVPTHARVFPVGRLDLDSTGVLLLTNDGDLAARLLHPRFHVEKGYLVRVRGVVDIQDLRALRRGVMLEDGPTSPAVVEVLEVIHTARGGPQTALRVVVHEGRKRQVRRMMEAVGHKVLTLHRTRFAGLGDAGLQPGQARKLSDVELATLRRQAGS